MLPSRGKSEEQIRKEMQKESVLQERHSQNLARSAQEDPAGGAGAYAELMESQLDPDTIEIINMLLARDWSLGNISDAEHHEIKWLREIYLLMIKAIHPSDDTAMKGKKRRLVYSNNGEIDTKARELKPLDGHDILTIESVLDDANFIASRSIGGFQWDEIAKSYSVSEVREGEKEDAGGWLNF